MAFQQMMWKVAMLLFIAMMLVDVSSGNVGCGFLFGSCVNGDDNVELDAFENLSDSVINAAQEKW